MPRDSWPSGDLFGFTGGGGEWPLGVKSRGAATIHRAPSQQRIIGPNVTGAEVRDPELDWVNMRRCHQEYRVEDEVKG